ncbi:MAG: PAS domain S-box protein [Candidatus Tectomicrobia bacterium]|nr:PAS domain S-box protein [Candidatus Tectomicrobia bacterium]
MARRLNALLELSRQISATLDPQGVLDSFVEAAAKLVDADWSRLFQLSPDGKALHGKALYSIIPAPSDYPDSRPTDGSLTGFVARKRRAAVVGDIQKDPRWFTPDWAREEDIHAYVGIPLIVRGQVVGVLNCLSKTPDKFGKFDCELLETLSAHAAIALQNARAFEEVRAHSKRQEALRRVTRDITGNLDLKTLFTRICKSVCDLLEIEFCRLFILDEKTGGIRMGGSFGYVEEAEKAITTLPQGVGIVHRVVSRREAVAVAEVLKDPDWVDREWAGRAGVRSYLGIPLILGERVVGVLNCLTKEVREFRPEEIALARDFADQAAIALGNARAFEALVRKSGQIARLNEINTKISASLDLGEALESIVEASRELLPGLIAGVRLVDTERRLVVDSALYSRWGEGKRGDELEFGRGLAGWVALHRRTLILPDARRDPRWVESPWSREKKLGGFVGIPLLAGDDLLGVYRCFTEEPREWTEDELEILKSLAAQATVAIQNARLHKGLASSEARYRTLFEQAGDAIGIADADGRILDCNRRACELLGYAREELLQKRVQDAVAPEYRDAVPGRIAAVLREGGVKPFESVDLRKDGARVPVEVSIASIEIEGQARVLYFLRDITERKRAEEEFRKLSWAVEQSANSILITDAKGNIEYVNPRFTQVTGYAAEEVVGKNVRALESGELPSEEYKRLRERARSSGEWKGELHNRKKSGELYWELVSISPIRNEQGEITQFVAVKEDITERKRAEEKLAAVNRRMQAILTSARDAIFTISLDRVVQSCNRAAQEMLGCPESEIVGHSTEKFHPSRDAFVKFGQSLRRALDEQGKFAGEFPLKRADGEIFPAEFAVNLLKEGENTLGLLGVVRDITYRKTAEETLRQAQAQLLRAEKLASIGTLVAGVAHEILNPVNTLSIKLQILQMGIKASDPEKLGEAFGSMAAQVERITRITKNLLQFARQREPLPKKLDVRRVLDQVADLVEYQYRVSNVDLVRDYAQGLPQIEGDEDQLSQVFLNLVGNARDAMPEGGRITLRARPFFEGRAPWVRVAVHDTGTGIPKGILGRIFDPFFTTKPEGKGTGLGLSIAYGIVESHGGRIDMDSREGEGTTFWVELPAKRWDLTGESAHGQNPHRGR